MPLAHGPLASYPLGGTAGQELAILTDSLSMSMAMRLKETVYILESVTGSDAFGGILTLKATLTESLTIADVLSDGQTLIGLLEISATVGDALSSTGIYTAELLESLSIGTFQANNGSTYIAIAFSPENKSIVMYEGYNFDGSCNFNGKTLFYNSTGIYEYGGTTDAGTAIQARFITPKMSFGSNHRKRIPRVWIANRKNTGRLVLKVITEDKTFIYHAKSTRGSKLAVDAVDIGLGLNPVFWQFELVSKGCGVLEIENLEFEPIELQRRV